MGYKHGHKALILLALGALVVASCAGQGASGDGAYRLIRPVADRDDAGRWAIIDKEGDPTEIIPEEGIAHEVEQGLSRQEALDRAGRSVQGSELSIRSISGRTAGSEVGIEVLPSEETMKPPPNLVRIEYRVDEAGRLRFSVRLLPLRGPAPTGSQ